MCVACWKPNPTNQSRCPECSEKYRLQRRENRRYSEKIGLCTVCNKGIPFPGKKICEDCLDKISEYDKKRNTPEKLHEVYKRKKAMCDAKGLCIGCKKRPARKGHAYCIECYAKRRRKQLETQGTLPRSERPKYGLCYICGNDLDNKTNVCTECRNKLFKRKE